MNVANSQVEIFPSYTGMRPKTPITAAATPTTKDAALCLTDHSELHPTAAESSEGSAGGFAEDVGSIVLSDESGTIAFFKPLFGLRERLRLMSNSNNGPIGSRPEPGTHMKGPSLIPLHGEVPEGRLRAFANSPGSPAMLI